MDVNAITQLIGSLGFPIVCCGYMMLKMNKTIEKNTEVTNEASNTLKECMMLNTQLYELITSLLTGHGGGDKIE